MDSSNVTVTLTLTVTSGVMATLTVSVATVVHGDRIYDRDRDSQRRVDEQRRRLVSAHHDST